MKLAQARAELMLLGMTIRHNDGEYRVAFKVANRTPDALLEAEASAYYTGDLLDAVGTGRMMYYERSTLNRNA